MERPRSERFLRIQKIETIVVNSLLGFVFVGGGIMLVSHVYSQPSREARHAAWEVRLALKFEMLKVSDEWTNIVPPLDGPVMMDGTELTCLSTNSPFIWASKLPDESEIEFEVERPEDARFYAHSKKSMRGKRWFIFTAPVGARFLSDDEVDWTTHRLKTRDWKDKW